MTDVSLNDLTLKLLYANKSATAETGNLYNSGGLQNYSTPGRRPVYSVRARQIVQ